MPVSLPRSDVNFASVNLFGDTVIVTREWCQMSFSTTFLLALKFTSLPVER